MKYWLYYYLLFKHPQVQPAAFISNQPTDSSCQPKKLPHREPLSTEPCLGEINQSASSGITDYQSKEQCTLHLKDPPEWKGSLKASDVAVFTVDKHFSKSTF